MIDLVRIFEGELGFFVCLFVSFISVRVDGAPRHGEDTIAASIAAQVRAICARNGDAGIQIQALPLVGTGGPFRARSIRVVGPQKKLPSGGFIYMSSDALLGTKERERERGCWN